MNIEMNASGIMPAASSAEPKEMLSVTEDSGVTRVRINFSSLAILQKCMREAEYSLVRGLQPQLEQPALVFGSAIHKALETYYCGERTERRIPSEYREIMQQIGGGQWDPAWSESLLFRAAREFVIRADSLKGLADENKRSIWTGVWMLTHYFQKYLTDEYVILRDAAGKPYVEKRVSVRLLNKYRKDIWEIEPGHYVCIDLFGTIDAILKSEVTGQILVADHKTASSLWDFYDKINPNFQYTGYVLAAQQDLKLDTNMFLVNALQVKAPPKTSRGSEPDFARQVTERGEEDFSELQDAVFDSVRRFLAHRASGRFPMSASGSCTAFYGSCRYREVCAAPKQLRENIISAKFAQTGHQV